jgi:hypothetical protein
MPILDYLERSASSAAFRSAVEEFVQSGLPSEEVAFDVRCPPVKVERTLIKILEAYPSVPIERVTIDATSGCEFFTGRAEIEAETGTLAVRFEWNCRWKAEQLGWKDWFGFPDQTRAAREFGHDCFRTWREEPASLGVPA